VRSVAAKLFKTLIAGVVIGIAGVTLIYGGWRFFCPYAEGWQTRAEVARLEQRVKQLREQNQRLQQQARLLATPEGVKIEARRLGLLKPGERSLRFMRRPEPRRTAPQARPQPAGALQRLRSWGRALFPPADKPKGPAGAQPPDD